MHKELSARMSEIADYSVRIYEGRTEGFIHRPQSNEDIKCAQEVIAIGAIWLDIFTRDQLDRTDGAGLTRLSDGLTLIAMEDLIQPVKPSPVATYLHDEPDLFRNDRLPDDE